MIVKIDSVVNQEDSLYVVTCHPYNEENKPLAVVNKLRLFCTHGMPPRVGSVLPLSEVLYHG